MDVETPTGGKDRSEGFAPEKRRMFHRGSLTEPCPGGLCTFHWDVGLGRLMMSRMTYYDVIQQYGSFGR
jgi:hypothetical protein